ncbi:MAG: hypothetical protein ACI3XA_04680 [Clostridia bacterium]
MAKRITDEQREIVIAARQSGESFRKCAEMAGISESAARRICSREPKRTEEEESAEKKGKEKFVENAWEIINGSMDVIRKRLCMAQADAGELMDIIEDIIDGKDLDEKNRNKLEFLLQKQARELTVPTLKELSNTVAVMYDKQALIRGKATENVGLTDEDRKLLQAVNGIEGGN